MQKLPRQQEASKAAPSEPTIVDLVKKRHTVIVELDPPRDLDIRKFMEGAKALKEAQSGCGDDGGQFAWPLRG